MLFDLNQGIIVPELMLFPLRDKLPEFSEVPAVSPLDPGLYIGWALEALSNPFLPSEKLSSANTFESYTDASALLQGRELPPGLGPRNLSKDKEGLIRDQAREIGTQLGA